MSYVYEAEDATAGNGECAEAPYGLTSCYATRVLRYGRAVDRLWANGTC